MFAMVREDGAAALRQRPKNGLLAGLWELPHVEGTLDEAAAARQLAAWGVTVLRWERTLHAKHEFTHLRWQMTGYLLTVAGEGQPDWLWADASQRRQRAIPSAFRVFTAALENAAAGEKSEKETDTMAQLYFKYGAMGSSKTANALMARFNYEERGQETLLVKPRLDTRDGDHMVYSRIGLKHPCIYFDEMRAMADADLQRYACIIIDEAQFLTKDEVYYLVHLVDDCGIPVICYGLRADFKGELFEGSYHLLVLADKLEEVKTICWCGKKAAFNARFDDTGHVVKEGAQVVLGANDKYIGLCRRHWMAGDLGPDFDIHAL